MLCRRFRAIGLNEGDHISICGANSANWVVAYLAIAAYKAVSVTILHTQTAEMIARQVNFADSKALFVDPDIWESLKEDVYGISAEVAISLDDFSFLKGANFNVRHPDKVYDLDLKSGDIDGLAQICFTSGSTDEPKGVMISYRNLSNNVQVGADTSPIAAGEQVVSLLPYSHVFGLVFEVLDHLTNVSHIFILGRCSSLSVMLSAFKDVQPCLLRFVPLLIERLFDRMGEKLKAIFGENLHQLFIGGAALRPDVEDGLRSLGIPYVVGYGSTETTPLISVCCLDEYKPHTVGKIVSGMEARISDEGEIMVRGENVMLGYYKNPGATRRKIGPDGWMHTGDRGFLDSEGYLHVSGRLEDDMIVLPSGENILPQSIEALLNGFDGVTESLVLERSGHLAALVYSADGQRPSDILPAINGRLPLYSQLKEIEFVTEPFQKTGKGVVKRYLYREK